MKTLPITEHQQGIAPWPSTYTYTGYAPASGLHRFVDEAGKIELFARTKSAAAGWHLRRGSWCFEFVRSL